MANPKATIVILTTGTPTRVLECLKKQTFQDFEVIIASEKGIVNAMNKALEKAKGEIFVRVDDDVWMDDFWLERILVPFSDKENFGDVVGVTGPTYVPKDMRKNRDSIRMWEKPNWFLKWLCDYETNVCAKIHRCGSVSYASNYSDRSHYVPKFPDHLEGTNWAMRTDLIRQVGGFDPKFDGVAEWFDTDVEQKILKLNEEYRLGYHPGAYVWHLLEKGEHYNDRFDGIGRIKNWLRYHKRHSKFHWKMVVFLIVWILYFVQARVKKCFAR